MVVRRRARRFLLPVLLYAVSAGMVSYFMYHANTGARGLEAKERYKVLAADLGRELDGARRERAEWERRIALLRSDQIDRDLLEERARVMLGRVHKNDLVIITGP
jgi:cell division protein FtsB